MEAFRGLLQASPGSVDPTAFAVCEQAHATGKDLISAAILGADTAARIVNAEDYDPGHGFDYAGTANSFGAAAAAGRAWKLDENQMLNAFGIVLNMASGSVQSNFDGVHTFKLAQGVSARNGIEAARLARKGFTGVKDPFFSDRGYYRIFSSNSRPEFLALELGETFHTKGAHKMYPSCYGNHAAIECCVQIVRLYATKALDIAGVHARVRPAT
ncbi:MAG: MmgE/PrpD family protein [Chloroflexi bacterium]|nr:MmgE/PrpD family protein [Chloroflexota bacterium]